MAQTEGRDAHEIPRGDATIVTSAETIYVGSAVGIRPSTGLALRMGQHVTLLAIGCARSQVTGDGVVKVDTLPGCFLFKNSASGDLLAATDVGKFVYAVDDETAAKTDASATRAVLGILRGMHPSGMIKVEVSLQISSTAAAIAVALAAALAAD